MKKIYSHVADISSTIPKNNEANWVATRIRTTTVSKTGALYWLVTWLQKSASGILE